MDRTLLRSGALFILCLALPLLAGAIGSLYTMSSIPTWYATLSKPAFTPPNWVFGPVWTTLYIMMGIALFLVIRGGLGYTASTAGHRPLCRPAGGEHALVDHLFWPAITPCRAHHDCRADRPCCRHHPEILRGLPTRRMAARPVPLLGLFCIGAERNDHRAELM